MTFYELRQKDVINIGDGRRLGRPIDLILNCVGERAWVDAIVVPDSAGFLKLFKNEREGCAIPWERIRRIGDDVILVDTDPSALP